MASTAPAPAPAPELDSTKISRPKIISVSNGLIISELDTKSERNIGAYKILVSIPDFRRILSIEVLPI